MYYEQLQALGAHYGLQKRAGLEKEAMTPAKVLPVLNKFNDARHAAGSTYSISPFVNRTNNRLKGGLTNKDVIDAISRRAATGNGPEWGVTLSSAGTDLMDKQYPYLSKLLRGRRSLYGWSEGVSVFDKAYIKGVTDALSSNSPTLRKALLARHPSYPFNISV